MNLKASRTRLEMLTNELLRRWDETKEDWRDAKASEFQRKYLEELSRRVQTAGATVEKMDALIQKVRSDCE